MAKVKPPTQAQYERAETLKAMQFCPRIYPCKTCGWPVVDGYVCTTCGDTDPSANVSEEVSNG